MENLFSSRAPQFFPSSVDPACCLVLPTATVLPVPRSIKRWLPSDEEYKKCEHLLFLDKKEQLLLQLWHGSQRRAFLLQMKAKYSGSNFYLIYLFAC